MNVGVVWKLGHKNYNGAKRSNVDQKGTGVKKIRIFVTDYSLPSRKRNIPREVINAIPIRHKKEKKLQFCWL